MPTLKKDKKNLKNKQKRINFIIALSLISLAALVFIIDNFRDNIVFFYSPAELKTVKIKPHQTIRVGGLVEKNSVKYFSGGLEFSITDYKANLKIRYLGIKPDLFREGQGTVAKGFLDEENNIFIAKELLTKHDEKYMPPEVKKALGNNKAS